MDPLENPKDRKPRRDPATLPEAVPAPDDERLKKIASIKKAVEDGTYQVSSEDVARKLIEHMLNPKS